MSSPTWIIDAVRTPVGRYGGGLASVRPDDLAAGAIAGLVDRSPALDPASIDDVVFGNGNGAGEENRNVARMSLLLAGLPPSVPGATVNRLCGSGLEAIAVASRAIETGDARIAVAGGVESMSRAPWVVPKPAKAFASGDSAMHSTTIGWRLVNPKMPPQWTVALGEGAEILADQFGIDRAAQDEFALASHRKADAAWRAGRFADEVVTPSAVPIEHDESVRPDTSIERLGTLKPVFRPDGSVTAGNSSPLNDGAAALLLASEEAVGELGVTPLARVVARASSAIEPHLYGLGPVFASQRALDRAGLRWADLALVEINEAFAAQALACLGHWPDLDPAIVNVNGGAIAIGHPIGCSGARITTTLVHELRRRGGGYGLATMCIGVGQGLAMVVEVPGGGS